MQQWMWINRLFIHVQISTTKMINVCSTVQKIIPLRVLSSLRNISCRSCLPFALTHKIKSSEESTSITCICLVETTVHVSYRIFHCLMEHVGFLFLPSPDNFLKQQRTGWLLHLRQRAMSSRKKNAIIIEKII